MLKPHQVICCLLAVLLGWLIAVGPLSAQFGPINIKVEIQTDKDYESQKTSSKRTVTEKKRLKIFLKNYSPHAYASARVQWYIIAEDYSNDELVIAERGEETVELPQAGAAELESTQAELEYTSAYTKKVQGRFERVDKSGQRYRGWGVQIFDGDELLSERFDPRDIKQVLEPKPRDPDPADE